MLRSLSVCLSLTGFWLTFVSGVSASEPVYQVEMIVFERTAPANNEVWPKNLVLEYPESWQRLFDTTEEAKRQAEANQADSLRLSDDFLQTLAQESAQLQSGTPTARSEQIPEETSAAVPPLPEFFAFLPKDQRGLQQTRNAIDRNPQMRVLFHETWRQPLTAIEKSPALLLHGGNRYGAYYELQGYIHLGISRFLHLHTNLWFTQFVPNHGQLPEHWPNLPVEPVDLSSRSDIRIAKSEFLTANDVSDTTANEMESTYEEPNGAPYLINQVVILQQKRRMRSGELHYVDHPKVGLLLKITPEK